MTINFRKVLVKTTIEGKFEELDLSKEVGNVIYRSTPDISTMDFSKEIYYQGEVDIPEGMVREIVQILKNCDFIAAVKVVLIDLLTPKNKENGTHKD